MLYVKGRSYVRSENCDLSEIKTINGMIRETVSNSVQYADILIAEGKLSEAKIYLKNAIEGIEALEG